MLPLSAGAVALGIFLVDTISTLEIAIAVVYVVVVLIAAVFLRRREVLIVSAACLALTVLSYLLTHEIKADAVVCFVVLRPGNSPSESLRIELSERVAQAMGKALKPEKVLFTRDLPKTRSAKIMRRVIRATYLGKPAGDVSSLENPDAVKAIGEAS